MLQESNNYFHDFPIVLNTLKVLVNLHQKKGEMVAKGRIL